jgi:hypothetical protein
MAGNFCPCHYLARESKLVYTEVKLEIRKSELPVYYSTPNNNYFTAAKSLYSNALHLGQ